MDYPEWYNCIDETIRDLVYLLRNNGFNTNCSCGHDMYVEMDIAFLLDIERLYDLLMENGYEQFIMEFYWETFPSYRKYLILRIGDKKDVQ